MSAKTSTADVNRSLVGPTRRLVIVAILVGEWSLLGGSMPLVEDYARWGIWSMVAIFAFVVARRSGDDSRPLPPGLSLLAVFAVGAWPAVCRALSIADLPRAGVAPWEVVLARSLTGTGIACAALAAWPRTARMAAAISVFLILFAHAFGDMSIPVVRALVAVYAALGCSWLMLDYWRRTPTLAAERQVRLPWTRRAVLAVALAGLTIAAGSWSFGFQPRRLGAYFASSGGSRRADSTARSGKQDGAATFRNDQVPESIGFTESENYLDSPRPSLYDLYNESLGEPAPMMNAGRVKSLEKQEVRTARGNPAASFEADKKSFTTSRKSPKSKVTYQDRANSALCIVNSPLPMHLRWTVYDNFDGVTWSEATRRAGIGAIRETGRGTWMQCMSTTAQSGVDTNVTVKVVRLTTNRAPTPADPSEFRCGKIDLADFFAWLDDGVLAMRYQKFLPGGAQFEFVSRQVDEEAKVAARFNIRDPRRLQLGGDHSDPKTERELDALVQSWIGSTPPGMAQVEAVVAGLRRHAALDRMATVPAVVTDSTVYFLMLSRRGPDYLFASSAAALLDRLGYDVRLASGFYADEASYDDVTGQAPLDADDLHFWAEVRDADGRWHIVEATPGFSIYRPKPSWLSVLGKLGGRALEFGQRNIGFLVVLVVAMGIAVVWRRELRDQFATWWWQCRRSGPTEQRVRNCLRILRRRGAIAGLPRGSGETSTAYVRRLVEQRPGDAVAELRMLARWADVAKFGPRHRTVTAKAAEVESTCRTVLQGWTINHLRGPTIGGRRAFYFSLMELFARCNPLIARRRTA